MQILKKKFVGLLALLFAVFFAACSDDSGSGTGAGFASEEDDPSSYIAEKIVPIKNKTISGYASVGSIVTIYELELDGKTFAQTGKSFTGKVVNYLGEFKIPNVSLKSQYALLKATPLSGNGVTLTAVTDLSKRENVNVNILTHLEYDRVQALLGKGMNFTSAKKQAGREVLAAFGIGLEENVAAEDLVWFGKSYADTALEAIGKLLSAGEEEGTHRDAADFGRLLAEIAISIEKNGTWGGSVSVAERIENIMKNYWNIWWNDDQCYFRRSYDGYSDSRKVSLPPEANILYQIYVAWTSTGQFCTPALDGEVFEKNFELYDGGDVRYMYFCNDGKWRFIGRTVRYSDYSDGWDTTNVWCDNFIEDFSRGKDGEIRKGDITDLDYKYDEKMGKWRRIDSRDTLFSTVCTLNHVGELIENVVGTVSYVCDENGWRQIAVAEENFGATCTDKNRGLCKQFSDSVFCCDSSGWRKVDHAYEEDVLEICTLDKRGKITKGLSGVSYICGGTYDEPSCVDIFGIDTCDYFFHWRHVSKFDSLISPCAGIEKSLSCMGKNVRFLCLRSLWIAEGCVGISTADSLKLIDYRKSGDISNLIFGTDCDRMDVEECPIEI